MRSSDRDHFKSKLTPTFFGLFETQLASLLKNVYAYIYNESLWHSGFISTCHGAVPGYYKKVSLNDIQTEFNLYNQETQNHALERVNQYVADFECTLFKFPTIEEKMRLLEVRDYFNEHIKNKYDNSNFSMQR